MTAAPLQQLFDSLATSVVVTDERLRVLYMNQAAEVLFAVSRRQAAGIAFVELAAGGPALADGLRRCLDADYPYVEHRLPLRLADRRTLTVHSTVTRLDGDDADRDCRLPRLMIELRQLDSQLKINREQQLLAQHETSKMLTRNLAHEIKNPLGGLRGAAQLLERELPDDELKEYTRIIIGEADRLTALVDRMLGPTRPPAARPVNIHEVLERVRGLTLADAVNDDSMVVIETDYDPSLPALSGDAEQLIQALLNIVRNAVQALAGRGDGRIVLRTRALRQQTIGRRRHRLALRVDIIDNGPGIAEALQADIFFPTISGRADGTGLGLSIAQRIVNAHGGLVEVRSRSGETVFSLTLPLAASEPASAPAGDTR